MRDRSSGLSSRETWLLEQIRGRRVLDVGFAGQKAHAPQYLRSLERRRPAMQLVYLDLDFEMTRLRGLADALVADAVRLPFHDNSFDCLILGEFLEHQWSLAPFLAEAARVLDLGGYLLVTTPNPYFLNRLLRHWLLPRGRNLPSPSNIERFLGHPDHRMLWDPVTLAVQTEAHGLRVVELTSIGLWLPVVGRWIRGLARGRRVRLWPLTRLGHITCMAAVKDASVKSPSPLFWSHALASPVAE